MNNHSMSMYASKEDMEEAIQNGGEHITERHKHDERRLVEERHDRALAYLHKVWELQLGRTAESMYVTCTNGDESLCEEAQDIFNEAYGEDE